MFTGPRLRHLLFATFIGAASGAHAALPHENNIASLLGIVPNMEPHAPEDMEEPMDLFDHEPPLVCNVDVPQHTTYFDEQSLLQVDSELLGFRNWLEKTERYNANLGESFFASAPPTDYDRDIIKDAFSYVFMFEAFYKPGTESGRNYLRANPNNAIEVAKAYIYHAGAQMNMLNAQGDAKSKLLAAFLEHDFEERMHRLHDKIMDVQGIMYEQKMAGCALPPPFSFSDVSAPKLSSPTLINK